MSKSTAELVEDVLSQTAPKDYHFGEVEAQELRTLFRNPVMLKFLAGHMAEIQQQGMQEATTAAVEGKSVFMSVGADQFLRGMLADVDNLNNPES